MQAVKVARSSSLAGRRKRAVESFKTAADCLGKIEPGLAIFAMTRGQFSMIDAVLHVLDELGPSTVTLWTWTIAEYEIERLNALRDSKHVQNATLMIDRSAQGRNAGPIAEWRSRFGQKSVRLVSNHAKIAALAEGESCVDNDRVALKGNTAQTRRYMRQKSAGCCGFCDVEAVCPIDGKTYLLGFNCGH